MLVGSAISSIRSAEAVQCPSSTIAVNLTTAADLQDLRHAINCSGRGEFYVAWRSSLLINQTIEITEYKNVRVVGYGLPIISYGLPNNNDDDDDNDDEDNYAESTAGMFLVSHGSTLSISSLVLDGGYSDKGGAVAVHSSSILYVLGCAFTNNTAKFGGAINLHTRRIMT